MVYCGESRGGAPLRREIGLGRLCCWLWRAEGLGPCSRLRDRASQRLGADWGEVRGQGPQHQLRRRGESAHWWLSGFLLTPALVPWRLPGERRWPELA
jgi:hypothetical protein